MPVDACCPTMSYLGDLLIQNNHYEVLGVTSSASESEIKTAYRIKLLSTHPDKVGGVQTRNEISQIQEAYQTLVDPVAKKEYDDSFNRSVKRQGFNVSGDGLDTYGLEEFDEVENGWSRQCPRCTSPASISLSEEELEANGTQDDAGGYDIIVQCSSCSLWIKVKYYEAEDE